MAHVGRNSGLKQKWAADSDSVDGQQTRCLCLHIRELSLTDGQNWILHLSSRNRYMGHPCKKEVAQPMSKATLRGYVRALKVWASYLAEEGYTKTNVFARIRLPADTRRVVDVLSEDETLRIVGAVNPAPKLGAKVLLVSTERLINSGRWWTRRSTGCYLDFHQLNGYRRRL